MRDAVEQIQLGAIAIDEVDGVIDFLFGLEYGEIKAVLVDQRQVKAGGNRVGVRQQAVDLVHDRGIQFHKAHAKPPHQSENLAGFFAVKTANGQTNLHFALQCLSSFTSLSGQNQIQPVQKNG